MTEITDHREKSCTNFWKGSLIYRKRNITLCFKNFPFCYSLVSSNTAEYIFFQVKEKNINAEYHQSFGLTMKVGLVKFFVCSTIFRITRILSRYFLCDLCDLCDLCMVVTLHFITLHFILRLLCLLWRENML